jgi:hypothetical protein
MPEASLNLIGLARLRQAERLLVKRRLLNVIILPMPPRDRLK